MLTCLFEDGGRASLRHTVVHAVVERDGALLFVRRAEHLQQGGTWGLPGGFLDLGETLAEAVMRELYEETGWTGRVIGLLRINSNPNRPREDRQNVAFDFVIEPLAQTGQPDAESSAIAWIPIDRLPPLDSLSFDHGDTVADYLRVRGALPPTPRLI